MKSFECESSSEGDEPNIIPISRTIVEPQQWLKGGAAPAWGWQTVSKSQLIAGHYFINCS